MDNKIKEMLEQIKALSPDAYNSLFVKHSFTFVEFLDILSEAQANCYGRFCKQCSDAPDSAKAFLDSILDDMGEELLDLMMNKYKAEPSRNYRRRR